MLEFLTEHGEFMESWKIAFIHNEKVEINRVLWIDLSDGSKKGGHIQTMRKKERGGKGVKFFPECW